MPVLRRGDDSPLVSEVQEALKTAGFYTRRIDGDFGDGTENAVRAFQLAKQLPVSGVLDEPTATALGLDHLAGPAMQLNPEHTTLLFPGARFENLQANLPFVAAGLAGRGLTDKPMILMALATIRAETSLFLPISEGISPFNTTPGGRPFDRYDDRADLGNEGPPDGNRYKGRGYIQLTGRANYRDIGRRLGLGDRLVEEPELANDPHTAGLILAEFLKRAQDRIRTALTANDLTAARKAVNGGTHGLNPFRTAYLRGQEVFAEHLELSLQLA